jgi:hypothetical protein
LCATAGSALILVIYADERHSSCGTVVGLLRGLSLPFAVVKSWQISFWDVDVEF